MAVRKSKVLFDLGQSVYLLVDRSEWQVTHYIIDINNIITYRLSNGYDCIEVFEQQITTDANIAKPIKGFK